MARCPWQGTNTGSGNNIAAGSTTTFNLRCWCNGGAIPREHVGAYPPGFFTALNQNPASLGFEDIDTRPLLQAQHGFGIDITIVAHIRILCDAGASSDCPARGQHSAEDQRATEGQCQRCCALLANGEEVCMHVIARC